MSQSSSADQTSESAPVTVFGRQSGITLAVATMLLVVGTQGIAGEPRAEVRDDWLWQHSLWSNQEYQGKNGRSAAPLVDEQAGRLKEDRDPTDQVGRRTAALLRLLQQTHPSQQAVWQAFQTRLDPLLAEVRSAAPDPAGQDAARQKTYLAVCALRREIALANPLLNFDSILFNDQCIGAPLTRATTGRPHGLSHTEPGGSLWIMRRWKDAEPELVDLCRIAVVENGPYQGQTLAGGAFYAPSLGYDGQTVFFAWAKLHYRERAPIAERRAEALGLFRIGVDGTGLRQLTVGGPHNDIEPCELPDGRIAFMSTRREVYDRCECCRPAFTLCSMKPDGSDILLLSRHETHEWLPSVSNDGMILYSRWDYVDRATWAAHGFWTCFPDGRDPRAPNGNYFGPALFKPGSDYVDYDPKQKGPKSPWGQRQPMAITSVRAIPGSRRLIGIGSSHHQVTEGQVLLMDLDRPDDYLGGQITQLTPGRWGGDPWGPWGSPLALSEDFFLATFGDRIYLADRFGNQDLVYRLPWTRNRAQLEFINTFSDKPMSLDREDPVLVCWFHSHKAGVWRPSFAQPVRPRPRPPVIPPQTWQSEDRRGKPGHQPATIVIQNVYDTDIPLPAGVTISALRLVQVLGHSSGGQYIGVKHNSNCSPKLVLGTTPVEKDGSVHCLAPIDKGFYFQLLDQDGLAVHSMKSVTYVHAGERLSCRGCHESYASAPRAKTGPPLALSRPPTPITPEGPNGKLLVLDEYLKPAAARVLAAAAALPGGPPSSQGAALEKAGWIWQFRCNVIHAPPDVRTTPDRFGARQSRIWEFVKAHRAALTGLQPDDLRLFALWLDLLCVDYSFSDRKTVAGTDGYPWPLHPDLDPQNPLGLEVVLIPAEKAGLLPRSSP